MRSVGIKALKNRLSEYLRLVASGETVLVTDRDRVVAELGPPGAGRSGTIGEANLAEAVRLGWLVPSLHPIGSIPARLPVAPLEEILRGLASDREDR